MQNDIINWSELSILLSGNRGAVRKNHIPKKYQAKVKQLNHYINCWKQGILLTSEPEFNEKIKDKNLFRTIVGDD